MDNTHNIRNLDDFFTWFFGHHEVKPYTNPSKKEWNRDWEFYNQIFAEMSNHIEGLIAYKNPNIYITTKPTLQFHNLPDINKIIEDSIFGEILMLHVSLYETNLDDCGHSCLLIFDSRLKLQIYFDPAAYFADGGISQRMRYTSLVDNYSSWSIIMPFEYMTPQAVLEYDGSPFKDTCGIVCLLVGLATAYTATDIGKVVNGFYYWLRYDRRRSTELLSNCISWYENMFIARDENYMFPM
jgi:hypothetical protein